jgi:hypothetical protein
MIVFHPASITCAFVLNSGVSPNGALLGVLALAGLGILGLRRVTKFFGGLRQPQSTPQEHEIRQNDGVPRIRGRASGDKLVVSPFTHTACCYYRAEVEQENSFDFSDGTAPSSAWVWEVIHKEVSGTDFLLQDSSGCIRVSPGSLDIDAPVTFEREVPATRRNAEDQALVDYVIKNCPDRLKTAFAEIAQTALLSEQEAADPAVQQKLQEWKTRRARMFQRRTKGQYFRFRERCILPGNEYAIAGVVSTTAGGDRVLSKGADGPFFPSP